MLQPHQQRVVAEHIALSDKIYSLEQFIPTDRFSSLDRAEKSRMRRQCAAMNAYADVLAERIAAFPA